MTRHFPLTLIILDGWGHREDKTDNGIELAHKPYFDSLLKNYPNTLIDGSGPAVGLPEGIMGNSEVGHMNLGAGRVVYSGLSQIYKAIEDGSFFKNAAFQKAMTQVQNSNSTLHLMGLLSDGAVHSHQDHLYALLELAKQNGIGDVAVHCFLDGRDTPPNDGVKFLGLLQEKMARLGVGRIASVCGRYYAMDRDQRWERVEKGWWALCGSSANVTEDVLAYVKSSYARGVGDEFVEPVVVTDANGKSTRLKKDDAVIFYNFRADRAREISHALTDIEFLGFDRGKEVCPAVYVCMFPYEKNIPAEVAFWPNYPKRILAEILSENKIRQLRIAETEKYAHVTYFFNGGVDKAYDLEDRVLILSPKEVPTYDQKPEMSAYLVRDELIKRVREEDYGVIICNFANTDMVGHTAKKEAIVKSVEAVDQCLAQIVPEILAKGGEVVITADHGNAEQMVDKNGEPMTAHTTNLVPFILVSERFKSSLLKSGGRLCDVAPTLLKMLNLSQPPEMTGQSLIC